MPTPCRGVPNRHIEDCQARVRHYCPRANCIRVASSVAILATAVAGAENGGNQTPLVQAIERLASAGTARKAVICAVPGHMQAQRESTLPGNGEGLSDFQELARVLHSKSVVYKGLILVHTVVPPWMHVREPLEACRFLPPTSLFLLDTVDLLESLDPKSRVSLLSTGRLTTQSFGPTQRQRFQAILSDALDTEAQRSGTMNALSSTGTSVRMKLEPDLRVWQNGRCISRGELAGPEPPRRVTTPPVRTGEGTLEWVQAPELVVPEIAIGETPPTPGFKAARTQCWTLAELLVETQKQGGPAVGCDVRLRDLRVVVSQAVYPWGPFCESVAAVCGVEWRRVGSLFWLGLSRVHRIVATPLFQRQCLEHKAAQLQLLLSPLEHDASFSPRLAPFELPDFFLRNGWWSKSELPQPRREFVDRILLDQGSAQSSWSAVRCTLMAAFWVERGNDEQASPSVGGNLSPYPPTFPARRPPTTAWDLYSPKWFSDRFRALVKYAPLEN